VKVLKADVSVEISVVKSVEVEKFSEKEVSVVESEVEISVEEESGFMLEEEASEVEISVDKISVEVLKEESEDE
jgi:hypothetical protein